MKKGKRWIIIVFLVAFLILGMTGFVQRKSISSFVRKVFADTNTATVQHMSFTVLDGMTSDAKNTNGSDSATGVQWNGKRYVSEGFVYSVMYYSSPHLSTYLGYDSTLTNKTVNNIKYKVSTSVAEYKEGTTTVRYKMQEYYTSTTTDFYCITFIYSDTSANRTKITNVLNSVSIT